MAACNHRRQLLTGLYARLLPQLVGRHRVAWKCATRRNQTLLLRHAGTNPDFDKQRNYMLPLPYELNARALSGKTRFHPFVQQLVVLVIVSTCERLVHGSGKYNSASVGLICFDRGFFVIIIFWETAWHYPFRSEYLCVVVRS